MKLQVMPLLRVQRELYDIPLGRARFERYLDVMIGGSGDIVLPLGVMNPMRCSAGGGRGAGRSGADLLQGDRRGERVGSAGW
jgi:hypothetical protein